MENQLYASDVQRLKAGFDTIGLPIAPESSPTFNCALSCYLYRNPDGTIRWLWPVGANQPDFLRFYHRGGRKARVFVWLVTMLFRLRLGRLIAHDRLTLYTTEAGYERLCRFQLHRWALFTGTVGPNRKLVIWYNTTANKSYFLKIALAAPAVQNIDQEALALRHAQKQPFLQIDTPRVKTHVPGLLIQEDMGTPTARQTNRMADLPSSAMRELVSQNWQRQPLADTVFWQQARQTLSELRSVNDLRIPVSLLDKIDWLMNSLNEHQLVPVAAAHGDCTPWNVMLRDNRLCIIDWELHQDALPGLYDLFHFVYQSAILIGNRGYGAIWQDIEETLNRPEWQLFCERYEVDTELAEILYLIHTLTYYLSVYSRQAEWHQQVNWLLATWNESLTYWLHQQKAVSHRQLVLHDMAFWLHQQPHAALKFMPAKLAELPESSDLDLCLPQPVAAQLTQYLQDHPLVRQMMAEPRSFMNQLHLFCLDSSILHVDLIWKFKRKQLEFMAAEPVWQQATLAPHGLKVPSSEHLQAYIRLFYGLNNAPVPERYMTLFDKPEDAGLSPQSVEKIRRLPQNRGWRGLLNKVTYGWDTLSSFAFRRGMIVTFSGVDGAGKSTVIEQTKQQIEKRLRQRVVVLRHRPSLLPILSAWKYGKQQAEQRAADTLPRQGTNQSATSSLLRFAYYYADYLFGQFYIQVKYVWRGYIVLYDRYYFDFINDGRRSNINLPPGMATILYGLLLKPRLNVFLYAPPEEILRRKQELDSATITELTRQYLGLFEELQKRYPSSEYLPVLNQHLPRTLTQIFDRIQLYSL
ncbi:phosphotransferase [Spirosoma sp. KNUC1025]|uniref:phosphotransferase n=1 Tax=Spirosoma sp. KNUC1025 TaxID=2894082 RepID=UPI00386EBA9B|nr:phosphotransferase [Spirosoma sp. KNUC1025]